MTSASDWWRRAHTGLDAARMLERAGFTNSATSEAYYVVFWAAQAMLMARGVTPGKTHSGVHAQFAQHLVASGLLPAEASRIVGGLNKTRSFSDYEGRELDQQEANDAVEQAERFLELAAPVYAELQAKLSG